MLRRLTRGGSGEAKAPPLPAHASCYTPLSLHPPCVDRDLTPVRPHCAKITVAVLPSLAIPFVGLLLLSSSHSPTHARNTRIASIRITDACADGWSMRWASLTSVSGEEQSRATLAPIQRTFSGLHVQQRDAPAIQRTSGMHISCTHFICMGAPCACVAVRWRVRKGCLSVCCARLRSAFSLPHLRSLRSS